jgi:hypothetical protein
MKDNNFSCEENKSGNLCGYFYLLQKIDQDFT